MWFGLIVGVVLGYIFKPQIDNTLRKVANRLTDGSDKPY
jgi:hypothetical protein